MRIARVAKTAAALLSVSITLIVLACTKDSTGPDRDKVEIDRNVIVLDSLTDVTIASVTGNTLTLTFPGQPPDINRWNILASSEQGGFLRNINTIQTADNTMTLETGSAVLTDAVVNGRSDTTYVLSLLSLSPDQPMSEPRAHFAAGVALEQGQISLSGLTLFNGRTGGTNLEVRFLSGHVTFEPMYHSSLQISEREIADYLVSLEGTLDFTADVVMSCDGPVDFGNEFELASFRYDVIRHIGALPITESITLSLEAGFDVMASHSGQSGLTVASAYQYQAGAEYRGGQWETLWDPDITPVTYKQNALQQGRVQLRVRVRPQTSVTYYSAAGATVGVETYHSLTADSSSEAAWSWSIQSGMTGSVSAILAPLDGSTSPHIELLPGISVDVASDQSATCDSPHTPAGPSPTNGVSIPEVPPALSWARDTLSDTYTIFLDGILECDDITDTICPLTQSLGPGEHSWRVVAMNECDTTTGTAWTFTVDCPAPEQPTHPTPANGAGLSDAPVDLAWTAAERADRYLVELDGGVLCDGIETTSCPVAPGLESGSHTWRVLATNDCGTTSGPTWSFSINCPLPQQVVNVSPADGDTLNPGVVELEWSPVNGADFYDVYLEDHLLCLNLSVTSCSTSPLLDGGIHTWNVVAKNACGETAGPTWSFLICTTAQTPELPNPPDGDTTNTPPTTLAWRFTTSAFAYDVYLDDQLLCDHTADTSCAVGTVLSEGPHVWSVVAYGTCGATSGPIWDFVVCLAPSAPTFPVPVSGASLDEAPTLLDWSDADRAQSYDVYVDDDLACEGITSSECSLSQPLESGNHHWQVIAHGACASTLGSDWSFSVNCPLPAAPSTPTPPSGDTLAVTPVSLTWADDPTATAYDVRLDGLLVCTNVTSSECELASQVGDGTHTWQVVARNECGDVEGDVWTFSICSVLADPEGPVPGNDASLSSVPVALRWDEVTGATSYDVMLDGLSICAGTAANSCALASEIGAGMHIWQVIARGVCDSSISPVWHFSLCAAPAVPSNPIPPDGDSLTEATTFLGWALASGATGYDVWLDGELVCKDVNQGACNLLDDLALGDHQWQVYAFNACDTTAGPIWEFTVCPSPGPPTVPVPVNGANLSEAPTVLDWSDSPEAASYDVWIDSTMECSAITESQCTVTRDLSTGTHVWQVTAHNSCGKFTGPVWTFSIDCPLPAEPTLPNPADNDTIATSPVLLDWADAIGAEGYDVRIDGLLACVDVTNSECPLGVSLSNGTHTLQVTSRNACGAVVGPDWTFTICPPPGVPTTPSPADGDTLNGTPSGLDWNDVTDVDSYDVVLNGAFECTATVLSECSVSGPLTAGDYTWQVIARNACDSTASAVWHFTVCDPPAVPDSPVPADNDTSSTAPTVLDWADASGAQSYDVLLDGDTECAGISVSECTIGSGLIIGDHTWQVIAHSACDSSVGPVWTFTLCGPPLIPSTPSPADDDTLSLAPTILDWSDIPGATGYDVVLDGALECSDVATSECTVVTSLSAGVHTWRVTVRNACDSTAGPVWSFFICDPPAIPANPQPADADTVTTSPIALDWDDVPGATTYRVSLGGVDVCVGTAVSACTLSTPLTAGDYNWQVMAYNDCDSTPGATWSFTLCFPPGIPQTPAPPDGDTLLSSPSLLDWDDTPGAATYDVYVDGSLECSGLALSECSIGSPLGTGDFTWYVVARNSCDSLVGPQWGFTVCLPPDTPAGPSPADGDSVSTSPIALDWNDTPGADSYDVILNGSLKCAGLATSACTLSVPLTAGDYTWRVVARNECDSTLGALWQFTLCDPPSVPVSPLPPDGDTVSTPPTLLDWDDAPGALRYDLLLDGSPICLSSTNSECAPVSTPTVGDHTWQVVAYNDCDSTPGPVWTFTVCDPPDVPDTPSPLDADTLSSAPSTLDWNDTPNAASYDVLLNGAPECTGLTASECTVVSLLTAGDYTWQVIARNGCDSSVGPVWSFTVCDPPDPLSIPAPADNDSLTVAPTVLDWADVAGAITYDVLLDSTPESTALVTSQCTVSTILSDGDHTWQVIARNPCDSTVGPVWHFNLTTVR